MSDPSLKPIVDLAVGAVDEACARYSYPATSREKCAMMLSFLADWFSRMTGKQGSGIQEVKITWPTGGPT